MQQPALRLDYQLSHEAARHRQVLGRAPARADARPGYDSRLHRRADSRIRFITNYAVTANYTVNPTTFLEGTYGFIRNELTGGNENGILMNDSANRLNGLAAFPLLYPTRASSTRGYVRLRSAATTSSRRSGTARNMNLPPIFYVGRPHRRRAAEPALPRLAEHQPDAGRGHQLDEGRRPAHAARAASTTTTATRRRTSARQRLRSRATSTSATTRTTRSTPVRLRQRGAGRVQPVSAGARSSSKAACSTTTPRSTCRTTGR